MPDVQLQLLRGPSATFLQDTCVLLDAPSTMTSRSQRRPIATVSTRYWCPVRRVHRRVDHIRPNPHRPVWAGGKMSRTATADPTAPAVTAHGVRRCYSQGGYSLWPDRSLRYGRERLGLFKAFGVHQTCLGRVLQQVERWLPLVAGRLHHHPGRTQAGQPIQQHQQRTDDCPEVRTSCKRLPSLPGARAQYTA